MKYKRWFHDVTIAMCCNVVTHCVAVTLNVRYIRWMNWQSCIYIPNIYSAYTHQLIDILFCRKWSYLALAFRNQADKLMFDFSGVSGLVVDENRFLPPILWWFTDTAAYALHCTFWLNRQVWSTEVIWAISHERNAIPLMENIRKW